MSHRNPFIVAGACGLGGFVYSVLSNFLDQKYNITTNLEPKPENFDVEPEAYGLFERLSHFAPYHKEAFQKAVIHTDKACRILKVLRDTNNNKVMETDRPTAIAHIKQTKVYLMILKNAIVSPSQAEDWANVNILTKRIDSLLDRVQVDVIRLTQRLVYPYRNRASSSAAPRAIDMQVQEKFVPVVPGSNQ